MLIRNRLSRMLFERNFYDYPVSLSVNTFRNLDLLRIGRIAASYAGARMFPIKNEKWLEDFFINRFGGQLYRTFFKDYTEKVWGVACNQIEPEWGAQRIKGLSITGAVLKFTKTDSQIRLGWLSLGLIACTFLVLGQAGQGDGHIPNIRRL